MSDSFDDIIKQFAALVERVRSLADLPCVCIPAHVVGVKAHEAALAKCTPCHLESLFDETLEHAKGQVEYIEEMAANHPPAPAITAAVQTNVVRFHPTGRKPQPDASWKD
jgi:hypothetical protein